MQTYSIMCTLVLAACITNISGKSVGDETTTNSGKPKPDDAEVEPTDVVYGEPIDNEYVSLLVGLCK